jgi:hypothetical protein
MGQPRVKMVGAALLVLQLVVCSSLLSVAQAQLPAAVPTQLSFTYYAKTCPAVYTIVDRVVWQHIQQSGRNIVGGLLRLHFHDCFVRVSVYHFN